MTLPGSALAIHKLLRRLKREEKGHEKVSYSLSRSPEHYSPEDFPILILTLFSAFFISVCP
jgi:hypothetical protein